MALTPKRSNQRSRLSKDVSKEALLDCAAGEIIEADVPLDLVEFSMEDIIVKAGVSRSATYGLFGGLAGFRQAVVRRIAESDPYSQGEVDMAIGEVIEAAQQGSIERPAAITRVGRGLAAIAFSPVALNMEHIVNLKESPDTLFYLEAAHVLDDQQRTLRNRLDLHLPILHAVYSETLTNTTEYAHDLLAEARGTAAYPRSDNATHAAFNSIADAYVLR